MCRFTPGIRALPIVRPLAHRLKANLSAMHQKPVTASEPGTTTTRRSMGQFVVARALWDVKPALRNCATNVERLLAWGKPALQRSLVR